MIPRPSWSRAFLTGSVLLAAPAWGEADPFPAVLARLCAVAMEHKQAGRYAAAELRFQEVLRLAPEYVDAHWGLAWTYLARGRDRQALSHFREVMRLEGDTPRARQARAAIDRLLRETAVTYRKQKVAGVPVHAIFIDLAHPRVFVDVVLSQRGIGSQESFRNFLDRTQPVAAINGSFFDPRTLRPVGDIVINNRLCHAGNMGTVLALTEDNQVTIRRVPWGRQQDWGEYRTVLGCGPLLVQEGRIAVQARSEGFRDPHVLGRAARSAVGATAGNKLVLVSVSQAVSLEHLALIMRALGCQQAMNLDGGSSRALYYRGRILVSPSRALTNVLLIRERPLSLTPVEKVGETQYQAGLKRKRKGRLRAAVSCFLQALRYDPDHLEARYALAWTYAHLKEKKQAIRQFREVLQRDPQGPRATEARQALARLTGDDQALK